MDFAAAVEAIEAQLRELERKPQVRSVSAETVWRLAQIRLCATRLEKLCKVEVS